MTTEMTAPRAAWIGVSDDALPALRRAFRAQLRRAVETAYPDARVWYEGYDAELMTRWPGEPAIRLWEPNWFWSPESEDERCARAVAVIAQIRAERGAA